MRIHSSFLQVLKKLRSHGQTEEEELREISVDQAKAYMEEGHFGKYNMYPKFRAAVEFLEKREGRSAWITSFDKLDEAPKKDRYTYQIKLQDQKNRLPSSRIKPVQT